MGLRYLCLLILPIFGVVLSTILGNYRGAYWWGLNFDPEYQYLLNSASIALQKAPAYTDHPGTTLQILGSIVLKASHFWQASIDSSIEPLAQDVLLRPETYLNHIHIVILGFVAASILAVGLISFRLSKNLALSLILQVAPFLSDTTIRTLNRVSPEPLLLCLSQMLVLLCLLYLHDRLSDRSRWLWIGLGICFGVGMATKVTFLPIILSFLPIAGFKLKFLALLVAMLSFAIATLPIVNQYPRMFGWLTSIATHTGQYGSGNEGVIDVANIPQTLNRLVTGNPFYFSLIVLSTGGWLWFRFQSRQEREQIDLETMIASQKLLKVLGIILAIAWVQIAITIKHPAAHYLMPSLGLSGLLIFVQVRLWQITAAHRHLLTIERWLSVAVLTICLSIASSQIWSTVSTTISFANDYTQELTKTQTSIDRNYPTCLRVRYYISPSQAYALAVGDEYSGG